jgi:hypothetical protein
MINRRTTILTIISAILFSIFIPGLAAAQSNDPWRRDDRNGDYRRDRRRDRDDDYYGNDDRYGRSGQYGNYDSRSLRDLAERVKQNSKSLERDVDRFLDNSRVNGTRREDRINNDVQDFRRAAERFRSRVDDSRDLNRSRQEAQNLLQAANRNESMLSRLRVDSRTYADWRQIKQDLRTIANIYGLSYNGYDDGYYRNGGYDPRDRDRNGRNNNGNIWRRLPGIINGRP